jgi:hypothetical protein
MLGDGLSSFVDGKHAPELALMLAGAEPAARTFGAGDRRDRIARRSLSKLMVPAYSLLIQSGRGAGGRARASHPGAEGMAGFR